MALRWYHRWFPPRSPIPCTHPAQDHLPVELRNHAYGDAMTVGSGYGSGMDLDIVECILCSHSELA